MYSQAFLYYASTKSYVYFNQDEAIKFLNKACVLAILFSPRDKLS